MSGSITSPLTLQMLMANGGAMGVPQDPAVAAALPRLQLAQSMMQSGMSTAPTEKYGALSRVAQAMLGNVMFDKANSGLQDILTQRAQQAGAANSYIMGGEQNAPGTAPAIPAPMPVATGATTPPVSTFATQLASSEGKPGSVNGQGFSGQFQFGADRLASTGLYNPAQGEDLKANQWKGTFNIPGFPDVKTQQDFLANPQAQNAALGVDIQNTDKAIANTPGAGAYDQNGLRAVAHLGGVGGMQKFIESNGQYNPADSNGTSLSDYYHKFSGNGGIPGAPSVSAPAPGTAPAGPNPWEVIRRAGSVLTNPAFQYNQQAQTAAQHAIDIAKLQISTGSYSTTPSGTQKEAYSGKEISAAEPRAQYAMTPTGAVDLSGTKPPVFARPGVVEQLTMSQLGDKLARGETLSPAEQIQLNMARSAFQHPQPFTTTPGQTVTVAPTQADPLAGVVPQAGGAPTAPGVGVQRIPQGGASMPPALTPEMPAATPPTGPHVVVPPNQSAIAGQAEAAAQGTKAGEQAAVTLPRMTKMGTEAVQGLGTIDSAISQLNDAQKQGIPTGYFTPALATAAAAAKSLGIDTTKLGVDPAGVSSIQAANKSLALTAGSIVRQILGPDSQITEGKLETFIHATPGLNTDPQAIQKILGWARSQFQYNHTMALDAMQHADPTTGMIPPGWESQYYSKQGSFGPIYNPLHGEMEQPSGAPPSSKMPTQQAPSVTPPTPSLDDVKAEMRRRGLMK